MSQPESPLAVPLPWNLVAHDYALEVAPYFTRYAEEAVRLAGVRAGMHVIDVAAGPGTLSFVAARAGARVAAIDFSDAMIEDLLARAEREQCDAISAHLGDGMALPFENGSFDAGFSMFGLLFFPDRDKGFRELARVLRPGGVAVVSGWVPMDRVPVFAEVFGAIAALLPGLPFGGGTPPPLGDAREFKEEMTAAGFSGVEVHEVTHALEFPELAAMWESFKRTNVAVVLLRRKLDDAEWQRVERGVLERLATRFGPGGQRVEMTANLGLGRVGG